MRTPPWRDKLPSSSQKTIEKDSRAFLFNDSNLFIVCKFHIERKFDYVLIISVAFNFLHLIFVNMHFLNLYKLMSLCRFCYDLT